MMKYLIKPNNYGESKELPQIIAVLTCCLAGVSSGLLFAWTSPAVPALVADPTSNITLEQASYFTVIFPIAMTISAPLVSLMEGLGRRRTVLLIAVPQLLAWFTVLIANDIWMFYVSRAIAGVADSIFYAVVSVYVCEITQPKVRGVWANAASISCYFGMFLMSIIGSYNDIKTTAVICSCFSIAQVVLFWFMPESPYFLLAKGKDAEARTSLQILRWTNDVEQELASLKSDVQRQLSESGTFRDLFTIASNRKALLICVMLRTAQQLSGLPAFESYTQYLFQQAGTTLSKETSSIIFTGVLIVCVGISAYVVELVGRRPLIIYSCLGCGTVLTTLTVYFYIKQYTNLDVSHLGWVPLAEMLAFIAICSPGLGIIPTLVIGELFSTSVKAKAVSVVNVVLALGYLTVPKMFQTLTHNVGICAPFLFFTCTCFACAVLSHLFLIETKGKTLEEIQQELKGNKQ